MPASALIPFNFQPKMQKCKSIVSRLWQSNLTWMDGRMVGWTDARDLRTSSTNGMNSNTIKRGFSFRFLERSKKEKQTRI